MSQYFSRVNTTEEVQSTVNQLNLQHAATTSMSEGRIQAFAPDNDVVYEAVRIAPNRWACRFHKEVFDPA